MLSIFKGLRKTRTKDYMESLQAVGDGREVDAEAINRQLVDDRISPDEFEADVRLYQTRKARVGDPQQAAKLREQSKAVRAEAESAEKKIATLLNDLQSAKATAAEKHRETTALQTRAAKLDPNKGELIRTARKDLRDARQALKDEKNAMFLLTRERPIQFQPGNWLTSTFASMDLERKRLISQNGSYDSRDLGGDSETQSAFLSELDRREHLDRQYQQAKADAVKRLAEIDKEMAALESEMMKPENAELIGLAERELAAV